MEQEKTIRRELTQEQKDFIHWKDDPKCPFATCFNGLDKERDRVCYEKNNKHYTLEQVFEFWKILNSEK
jgi:hypothetical protein